MIRINQLHVTTEAPLSSAQARDFGAALAAEVGAVLAAGQIPAPRIRIRELRLQGAAEALGDRRTRLTAARAVARRVLDRAPD
jgi:hypothetical protein